MNGSDLIDNIMNNGIGKNLQSSEVSFDEACRTQQSSRLMEQRELYYEGVIDPQVSGSAGS